LKARERESEQTVWGEGNARARDAGASSSRCGIRSTPATNKLRVLALFPVREVVVGKFNPSERIAHGIEIHSPSGKGQTWTAVEWEHFLQASEKAGWQLVNTEFRHVQFDTDASGQPKQSRFYFRAHLVNAEHSERAMFDGDLVLQWGPKTGQYRTAGSEAS
jgi:hypothetical protein